MMVNCIQVVLDLHLQFLLHARWLLKELHPVFITFSVTVVKLSTQSFKSPVFSIDFAYWKTIRKIVNGDHMTIGQ